MPRLVVAPDKFRGSLSAAEVVEAVRAAAARAGWEVDGIPMADGGEGLLEAFGGANRVSFVPGPLGDPVEAPWRLGEDGTAVVESALASGLALVGGPRRNDPVEATSEGTGQLLADAVRAGARRIVVGLGGSAMTDGGIGAVTALLTRLGARPVELEVELLVACDVETRFVDAARVFGPQKGAGPEQVEELTARLERLQERYRVEHGEILAARGLDLATLPGGGAAGGLGGGLAALGARLVPGLPLVAEHVGLREHLLEADAVITGEGALDASSFSGKVVGGVLDLAEEVARDRGRQLPVAAVVGTVRPGIPEGELARFDVLDLLARFGARAAWGRTRGCVTDGAAELLTRLGWSA